MCDREDIVTELRGDEGEEEGGGAVEALPTKVNVLQGLTISSSAT